MVYNKQSIAVSHVTHLWVRWGSKPDPKITKAIASMSRTFLPFPGTFRICSSGPAAAEIEYKALDMLPYFQNENLLGGKTLRAHV